MLRLVAALVFAYGITMSLEMDWPVFGPDGLKKYIRFMTGEKAQRGTVHPRSPQGRGSEHGAQVAPRRAAQAGWAEGAERSLEFAGNRMLNSKISRRLHRMVFSVGHYRTKRGLVGMGGERRSHFSGCSQERCPFL